MNSCVTEISWLQQGYFSPYSLHRDRRLWAICHILLRLSRKETVPKQCERCTRASLGHPRGTSLPHGRRESQYAEFSSHTWKTPSPWIAAITTGLASLPGVDLLSLRSLWFAKQVWAGGVAAVVWFLSFLPSVFHHKILNSLPTFKQLWQCAFSVKDVSSYIRQGRRTKLLFF